MMTGATNDAAPLVKRLATNQGVLTVLGLSGVAFVFLPFAHGEVPVKRFVELWDEIGWLMTNPRNT